MWTDSSTVEPAVTLVEAGEASIVVVEASTMIATIVTGAVSVAVSAGLMIPPRIMAGGEQVGHRVDAVMLWRLIFHLGDVRRTDGVLPWRTRWVTWRLARPDVARAVTRAVVGGVVVAVACAVEDEVSEVRDIYAAVRGEGNVHFEDAVCVERVGRKGFSWRTSSALGGPNWCLSVGLWMNSRDACSSAGL